MESLQRAYDIPAVIVCSASMIEIVEQRGDKTFAHLSPRHSALVKDARLVIQEKDVEHVPRVVIGTPQIFCLGADDLEVIAQITFVQIFLVQDDLRDVPARRDSSHGGLPMCRCYYSKKKQAGQ